MYLNKHMFILMYWSLIIQTSPSLIKFHQTMHNILLNHPLHVSHPPKLSSPTPPLAQHTPPPSTISQSLLRYHPIHHRTDPHHANVYNSSSSHLHSSATTYVSHSRLITNVLMFHRLNIYMWLSAIVSFNSAWKSAIVLILLFAGFRNLPCRGGAAEIFCC